MPYTKLVPNVSPYFDDFEKQRNFLRILFRPGYAVQARELTQIQTILQNQVESFANHIFKNGSSVIGAHLRLTDQAPFIEIPLVDVLTVGNGAVADGQSLLGHHIQAWTSDVNSPSGTVAEIVDVVNTAGTLRLQLNYKAGGFNIGNKFVSINYDGASPPSPTSYKSAGAHISAVGEGIRATIEPGIVWINGFFVQIPVMQEIFVSKTGTTGTFVIGYTFDESEIDYLNSTELDPVDGVTVLGETLRDPASSSNFGGVGANRYIIKLSLTSFNITDPAAIIDGTGVNIGAALPEEFYQVMRITNKEVESVVSKPDYADILNLLAGRTYDESGSYSVQPFSCVPKKFDANNFDYEMGPGKAYVFGYERENVVPVRIAASKTRTVRTKTADAHIARFGTFVVRRDEPNTSTFDYTAFDDGPDWINLPEHPYGLGDRVQYSNGGGTSPSGLTHNGSYYVIPVNKDYISLATTPANATAGTVANIGIDALGSAHTLTANYGTMLGSFDPTDLAVGYLMSGYSGTGRLIGDARVYFMDDTNGKTRLYLGSNPELLQDLQEAKSICAVNTGNPVAGTTAFMNIAPFVNSQALGFNQPIVRLNGTFVNSVTGINYSTLIKFGATSVTAGLAFSLNTGVATDVFQGAGAEDAIALVVNSSTGVVIDHNSNLIDVFGTNPTGALTQTITSDADHDLATATYDFYMLINRSTATVRTKVLQSSTVDINVAGANLPGVILNGTNNGATLDIATGTHFDVAAIGSVIRDPAGVAENVTSQFRLNTGQKDLFYDYSSIAGPFALNQDYQVTLHYWAWGGTGDYFAANSYSKVSTYFDDKGGFESHIPNYTNENASETYMLRDCLDFRRNITEISNDREIVQPNSTVQVNFSYYLPRWDRIWLDKEGRFGVTEGIAEEQPRLAPEISGTMSIFNAYVGPYIYDTWGTDTVFQSNQIAISAIDRKNYTMDDIRRLDRRIQNLEAYTSENQLELDSYSDTVFDKDGLPRSKSGIFVDKFVDHTKGNVFENGYRCTMGPPSGLVRCPFEMNHIRFEYDSSVPAPLGTQTNNSEEGAAPWANTITLDYASVPYVTQNLASETINVNPFNVMIWAGEIILNPWSDTWVETEYAPAMQITDPVEAAKILALYEDPTAGIPTWESWSSEVIGVTRELSSSGWVLDATRPVGDPLRFVMRNTQAEISTTRTTRTGTILEQTGTQTITRDMGERTINVSSIPWMREIDIEFHAEGMKPNTLVGPYFSNTDVSANVVWDAGYTNGLTNVSGDVRGTFTVPIGAFLTGKNVFTLKSSVDKPDTIAAAEFHAEGTLFTKQMSILSVEVPTYSTRTIVDRQRRQNREIISQSTQWKEPISQTFLIEEAGGVFLESIDIFFATKDRYIPVTLMIVETIAGLPGPTRVPFAMTRLLPHDVKTTYWDPNPNLPVGEKLRWSGTQYASDNTTVLHASGAVVAGAPTDFAATKFKFSDAIYLKEGTEYAFVLISNSDNYTAYISRMGGKDIISNTSIDKQPHIGSLLTSQNASTWTPDQYADIKFQLNRCDFDDSASAMYLRVRGTHSYYSAVVVYQVGQQIIFDHSTDGLGIYQCVTLTIAGENPESHAAKWLYIRPGVYDATLLNISMDNLVLPGTGTVNQWLSDPNTVWLDFTNKQNIEIPAKDTIELYREDEAQNPSSPEGINLKLQLWTSNTWLSPVINKNRTVAVLVNNLVLVPEIDAPTNPAPVWDAGEYISDTVYLKDDALSLKLLIDVTRPNENAIIVPKYRTIKANLRYVARDGVVNNFALQDLKDEFAYVYWLTGSNPTTITTITQKGAVIVDGLDTTSTPHRAYLSSIQDPGNFVDKTTIGTNPWIMITTEPDIVLADISIWAAGTFAADKYVIDTSSMNLFVSTTSTSAAPTLTSVDWKLVPAAFVNLAVQNDTDVEWRPMQQVGTLKESVDITQYVEYEYAPLISPSEEFDNFAIKIEMYSDDEVNVPSCKRLRVIAVN